MKVLVATSNTQGDRADDYCWTVEGELVLAEPVLACDSPGCGCDRGFPGLASSRATTTATVVERPDVGRSDLAAAIESSLERGGWLEHLEPAEAAELVDEHVQLIQFVTVSVGEGSVVRRRGGRYEVHRQAA